MPEKRRYKWQAAHTHLKTTAIAVEYAVGAGGRICDLPPRYLDAIAEAVLRRNPRNLERRLVEQLINGRFRRSLHPQLVNHTVASFRRERFNYATEYMRGYRARRRVQHCETKVTEPVVQ